MAKKITPVKYTDRDFESIKASLVEHAKRYYPNSQRDFNEASFGSLMLDTVSYIGDVLSFYLDYQTNENLALLYFKLYLEYQKKKKNLRLEMLKSAYFIDRYFVKENWNDINPADQKILKY